MSTPNITLTGTVVDLHGVPDSGGAWVQIILSNFNQLPVISGTGVIADTHYKATCNGSGVFSITLWGNDQISPSSTYYTVQAFSSSGVAGVLMAYYLTGSGTYDLSSLVPINTPAPAGSFTIPNVQAYTPVAHQFLTGLSSGGFFSSAQPAFSDISGTLAASQLPTPTSSTLGGVKSLAAVSHKYLTQIGNDGSVSQAQPSVADLSDGSTGSGAVVLATSPSISSPSLTTPTISSGGATFSGSSSGSSVLKASATASGTLTMPAATDTLVGQQTTDTLKNKTLTGASNANSVTLLNLQTQLSNNTGNSTNKLFYSYTIPQNVLQSAKAIRVTAYCFHVTGSAAITYGVSIGGTVQTLPATTGAASQTNKIDAYISFSVAGSNQVVLNGVSSNNWWSYGFFSDSHDFTASSVTIGFTFNVANTDAIRPDLFVVELIQ